MLADNATTEFAFVSDFFGQPSDRPAPADTSDRSSMKGWDLLSRNGSFSKGTSVSGDDPGASVEGDDSASVISMSEAGNTSTVRSGKADRIKRSVAESIWKQVMDPVLEYSRVSLRS